MGRSAILIILLNFILQEGIAQETISFRQADSATYSGYLEGNWNDVVRTGKLALDNDIDYFYLRLRMGIAYYNKQNYRAASHHLKAAEEYNPESGIAKEYAYYSYLFSGKYNEAFFLAGGLNDRMLEITGIPRPSIFSLLYAEAGPEFGNNFEQNSLENMPQGQDLRWQDLYGNSIYGHLGVKLNLHPRINLYLGYSYLSIDKKAELQYLWNEPDSIVEYGWGFRKLFPSQPKLEYQQYSYTLQQNGIYLKTDIYLGRGWSLIPAFHFVNVNTKSINIENKSRMMQDTAFYIRTTDSVAYFNYQRNEYSIDAQDLVLNNIVLSLGINKQVSIFDLGLFGSWSNLNDAEQFQCGFKAAYYPMGNLNLYGVSTLKGISANDELWPVFSQVIGFRTFNFLWAEVFGVFGNLSGTNESDAFVVYNISDEINLKTGLNLTFVLSPAIRLTARYQYLKKTGYRYISGPDVRPGQGILEQDYSNHSIIGGLQWIF
jgi:hypothetical protein